MTTPSEHPLSKMFPDYSLISINNKSYNHYELVICINIIGVAFWLLETFSNEEVDMNWMRYKSSYHRLMMSIVS